MRVAILAPTIHPHAIEIAGMRDALHEANVRSGESAYQVELVAERPDPIVTASGLTLLPDATLQTAHRPVDTLIVGAAYKVPPAASPAMLAWVRAEAPRARRYGSVCTGAFLLGEAGLLDGRRATTHWEFAAELAARNPRALIEPDRIFVRDGPLFTSAGVTAAFDLALALIEEDLGREVAEEVARYFVVYVRRSGGQSQFSAQLATQMADSPTIARIQDYVREHLKDDLSIGSLAGRAVMSPRNFGRVFAHETGVTPAEFVALARIDAARTFLEETSLTLQQVAFECGFANVQAMRRAFQRRLGLTPSQYRVGFRARAA